MGSEYVYGQPPSSISELSGLGQPVQQPQNDGQNLDQLGADVVGLGNERAAASEMPSVGGVKHYSVVTKPDGTQEYTLKMDEATFAKAQELMGRGAQVGALAGLAKIGQQVVEARNAQVAALKTRLAEVEAHPILAQLGRIASLAATAYIAPHSRGEALVRAAGAFAAPLLHDTPENLTAEIAQTEQAKLSAQIPVAQLEEQALSEQRRIADTQYNRSLAERRLSNEEENNRQTRVQAAAGLAERKAAALIRPDPTATYSMIRAAGADAQQAAALTDNAMALYKGAVEKDTNDRKADLQFKKDTLAAQHANVLAEIAARKADATKDRETQMGLTALASASDDYGRSATAANRGEEFLISTYQALNPDKPLPKGADAIRNEINKSLADPKNPNVAAFMGTIDTEKFRKQLADSVSDMKNFASEGPRLLARLKTATEFLPADKRAGLLPSADQAAKTAVTTKPSSLGELYTLPQDQFDALIRSGALKGSYTEEQIIGLIDKRLKAKAKDTAGTTKPKELFPGTLSLLGVQ